ncbi:hypothetical protein [Paenibacillus urinalis]|uniref:Uncharacterized protein n=1 Tax=Paenibacillus urinalis TaxID=521520 RepID=A0AAX3MZC6_9BACL|nr:hypothetical protein [Paenibacillus urinalis]WDH82652.1 hypothetical protein PUW23_24955 [Paenibacillus urinalis]WDI00663.1 hypothetical protein PUW25_15375 [Paenibacillus urinalis]
MLEKNGGNRNVIPIRERNVKVSLVPSLAISLAEAKERIDMLQQFVKEMMKEGLDYGIIEGFRKPTLFKPGAEKLCDIFGFSKHVNIINRIENWEKGIFAYEVKVTLVSKQTGFMEAEGIGTCNNKEQSFIDQDPFSVVNTLLKMAKKRALIDAVLSATRASGLFTQDIEDLPKDIPQNKGGEAPATDKQLQMIFGTVSELNMRPEVAKEMMQMMFQVDHSTKLTKQQASSFIQDLLLLKIKP